jgi:uncharacterized protein (TIGR03083 family)
MDADDYVEVVRQGGTALADAAEGNLDQRVPSCPDWTVAELVYHLGGVLGSWTTLATVGGRPEELERPSRPGDEELVAWFRGQVAGAVAGLGGADPSRAAWNWTGRDETVGWIQRRMAQEVTIHAWDGLNAGARPAPIATAVAIDGIDEYLEVFVGVAAPAFDGPSQTVHVHVTDDDAAEGEGEWLVTVGEGTSTLARTHAKGDVALRGPASDLMLVLWRRRPAEAAEGVEVIGDAAVLDRLLSTATF